jgi:hypothetical protein
MLQDAAVGLELCTRLQCHNEVFVAQANQLSQVAVASDGLGVFQ